MAESIGENDGQALIELDADRELVGASAFANRVERRPGIVHGVGVRGSGGPFVARAIHFASKRPVVYVAPDVETARRAADDLGFFASNASGLEPLPDATTLFLAAAETSPYADIHPERQSAMLRLASLFHLGKGSPFAFLVVPSAALV